MQRFATIKGLFRNPLFCFVAVLIVGMGIFSLVRVNKDKLDNNKGSASFKTAFEAFFSFSEEKNFFFNQNEILGPESPELSIIGGNSLISVSAPGVFDSKVYGALTGNPYPEPTLKVSEYIAEKNDSPWSIASKFNVSVDTIRWANNIGSTIQIGQKLIILPVDGTMHLVESDDTLPEIAKTYNYKEDLSELITFNNLSEGEKIYIGDTIIIPGGKMPSTPIDSYQSSLAISGFINPVSGRISQGPHWPPRFNAIDIANNCGTPIKAAASGKVYQTGYSWIGGYFIKISHSGGILTYYGHLSQVWVRTGQNVSQGETIGLMGTTGVSTGCHLHFDVIGARNPLYYYKVGTII